MCSVHNTTKRKMMQFILVISLTIIGVSSGLFVEVHHINKSSETSKYGGPAVQMFIAPIADYASGPFYNHKHKQFHYADGNGAMAYRANLASGTFDELYIDDPATVGHYIAFIYPVRGNKDLSLIGAGKWLLTYNEADKKYSHPFEITKEKGYIIVYAHADINGVLWLTLNPLTDKAHRGGELYRVSEGNSKKIGEIPGDVGDFAWSKDYKSIYTIADNATKIYKYKFDDEKSEIDFQSRKLFYSGPENDLHIISGIKVNKEGSVWITINDYGLLIELTPSGEYKQVIQLPVTHPTGLTFGDSGLFIASTKECTGRELIGGAVLYVSGINGTAVHDELPVY